MSTGKSTFADDNSPMVPFVDLGEPGEGWVMPTCCIETMRLHSTYNPMMMCPVCKQVIKCFEEEKAFRNYLTFCRSRHRKVHTTQLDNKFIITFRNYETLR